MSAPPADLAAFLSKRGFVAPPVPGDLGTQLERRSGDVWSTRAEVTRLHGAGMLARDLLEAGTQGFLAIGHDGRGTNSYAMHYLLADGPLALFVAVSSGGAYADEEAARSRWAAAMAACSRLLAEAPAKLGDDHLVVLDSDFDPKAWCRFRPPLAAGAFVSLPWQEGEQPLAAALAALDL